ncbi:membrane-spanning 4-domains subfamily A member 4A-like [Salminus brasiliensis]|uniref:membrane-spanning 4-domains subfamily A member 4A-like n=1 Tax=Salminus brasiliensis TaxID=930266 RepID=UPI003B82FF68
MSSIAGPGPMVTHVITQQIPASVVQNVAGQGFTTAVTVPPSNVGTSFISGVLGKFLKGEPKALGTVEIMIGVFVILSGIALTHDVFAFVHSGIAFWGALIHISAGSLAVAAGNKLHPCVVKGSLGMNVVSSVIAAITIIILSADLALVDFRISNYSPCVYCTPRASNMLLIVMLILTLLQFCISISISAFGCKATCCTEPMMMVVVSNPTATAQPAGNPPKYD